MKKSLIAAVAVMALAACSGGEEPQGDVASSAAATVAPTEDAGALESPVSTSEESAAAAADTIPSVLRGRWGLVPADCTSTKGDAKGLLTVGAEQLKFYESVAELGAVKAHDADMVTGAFQFTGEGQTWILDVTLATPDGGKTLVRKDTGPDAAPEPLTYTKCPPQDG